MATGAGSAGAFILFFVLALLTAGLQSIDLPTRLAVVPNEVRGRIMSIFQFNMGGAQLMTMPVALLGQWLTLPVLFPLLAGIALVTVTLILLTQRQILRA